jgi:drug/metabolite transporter (DMT)-like permease
MDSVNKGVLFILVATGIFGFMPILTRLTFDEGTNGVTIIFLRAAMAAPLLFVYMNFRKIRFSVNREEMRDLLLSGFADSATTILLYISYVYIPVGEATTLHFIYPALVSLGCVLFYREKLTKNTLAALALSLAGVYMFSDNLSFENLDGGLKGFLLAIASGFTFAIYVVCVDKTSLRGIPTAKLTFAVCVIAALCSGVYGGSGYSGGLEFGLSLKGWAYVGLLALSVSIVGIALFQLGIKYTDATTAAILSTFEPITSVVCGALFLGEKLSFYYLIGCGCIVTSVILVATAGKRKPAETR